MPCKAHRSIQRDDSLVPPHLTMVIHTASSHGFQTRIGAHLTRTVLGWNNNLDASLNKISSSVSPSRVSLPLIDAKAMNITSTQDDPDRASTHVWIALCQHNLNVSKSDQK